ncbi:RNA pyrophosphohydrolase [Zymomonas mobilis]|uniref:RNA pyrophosphohydrolase n=1 Tax=Zymomonas mobilis TaxID=542 RepID=UPI0021C4053B|nr:RNA pyrophosphohydrolase [Zymomonas mobilis]MCP9308090.1 RNA pyrophosphohydrolase [Zymomonas mobilis]
MDNLEYRSGVGIMLLNKDNLVFAACRNDMKEEAWQMPQGGLEAKETPEVGALRELEEETGIPPRMVAIISHTKEWLTYDFPADLQASFFKNKYRGQRQLWFLARYLGRDEDININTDKPEFRAWKWVEPKQLPDLIVAFKKPLYEKILSEFSASL